MTPEVMNGTPSAPLKGDLGGRAPRAIPVRLRSSFLPQDDYGSRLERERLLPYLLCRIAAERRTPECETSETSTTRGVTKSQSW